MYRLLIVTTDQATKDMLAAMEGWEALGVKPPRVRETVEDAVECMKKHPIDAIAVEDAPVFAPLGFGCWQAVAALLPGLTAKEQRHIKKTVKHARNMLLMK